MMGLLLDLLLLQPLTLIYTYMFEGIPSFLGVGGRIIVFGITLNLALMPLYNQMERRARQGRVLKERVARDVARMKAHFRGRERHFYIQAVYRQYGYHPIHDLIRSTDLLVQVIVFWTVYRFLSGHPALEGSAFGPILDLSSPDGLAGGQHLLPLLMTVINLASVFIYSKEASGRVQGVALALLFLFLLYPTASGMVLYWTCNNLFSLVRNWLMHRVLPEFSPQLTPTLTRFFRRLTA